MHAWPRFVLAVPSQLTQLRVAGDVGDVVACGPGEQQQQQQQQFFGVLQVFEYQKTCSNAEFTSGMPVTQQAQLITCMPRLRELNLDGASRRPACQPWATKVSLADVRALFAAFGAASQLTCLCVKGFEFSHAEEDEEEDDAGGIVGDQLQRLTALQALELDVLIQGARDVRGIASLMQLTSLRLRECGWVVQEQEVQELCGKLLMLQDLALNHTNVQSCRVLFGSVAQPTNLEHLNLQGSPYLIVLPEHSQLLLPLVRLRQLELPLAAYETCKPGGFAGQLLARLPRLRTVWAGCNRFNRGGQVQPRRRRRHG